MHVKFKKYIFQHHENYVKVIYRKISDGFSKYSS